LLFDELTCVRIEQNRLSAAPSACDFQKVYLRSFRCCNICQVNIFYFKRFDIMFILSSSPKVGICYSRLSQIWLSLPNTAIQSSVLLHANTLANQPTQQYFYLLDFMLDHNYQLPMPIFWEWNRKTFLGNFVTGEQDLEKRFFWQWELKQLYSNLW